MKKKNLYRQVMLSLMAGTLFAGQAVAADYTGVITGDTSDDAVYSTVKKSGGEHPGITLMKNLRSREADR